MVRSDILGAWGERKAAEYLRKNGYKILSCNYHCKFGEIDIIARKKHVLIFVEVKLRRDSRVAYAREYVGYKKQMRIRATAEMWLAENEVDLQPRFDVIEIYAQQGMDTLEPEIIHLTDAFS